MSFFNKLIEISNRLIWGAYAATINRMFKVTVLICIIIYLIIFYQSTLNHRYQFFHDFDDQSVLIFDTKKGEMYVFVLSKGNELSYWRKMSPFSKSESIPLK